MELKVPGTMLKVDSYELFFGTFIFTMLSLFIFMIGYNLYTTRPLMENIIIFPLASLFGIVVMSGLSDVYLSAKGVFWGWIGIMGLLILTATYGGSLVWIYGVIT